MGAGKRLYIHGFVVAQHAARRRAQRASNAAAACPFGQSCLQPHGQPSLHELSPVATGTSGSCPHSLQLPSYTATAGGGAGSCCMASSRMQAVVPVPQVHTTGCDRSSPASWKACASCSGGFSLRQQRWVRQGPGQAVCLPVSPAHGCSPLKAHQRLRQTVSWLLVSCSRSSCPGGRRSAHLPSCSTLAKARLLLPGMWPGLRPGRGSGASPFHLQARQGGTQCAR